MLNYSRHDKITIGLPDRCTVSYLGRLAANLGSAHIEILRVEAKARCSDGRPYVYGWPHSVHGFIHAVLQDMQRIRCGSIETFFLEIYGPVKVDMARGDVEVVGLRGRIRHDGGKERRGRAAGRLLHALAEQRPILYISADHVLRASRPLAAIWEKIYGTEIAIRTRGQVNLHRCASSSWDHVFRQVRGRRLPRRVASLARRVNLIANGDYSSGLPVSYTLTSTPTTSKSWLMNRCSTPR